MGESYSPYVYNHPSTIFKGYGVLQAVVKVKPGNQSVVLEKVKEIARSLDVSAKTVEAHRAKVMEKMQANSLAALVRMSISARR